MLDIAKTTNGVSNLAGAGHTEEQRTVRCVEAQQKKPRGSIISPVEKAEIVSIRIAEGIKTREGSEQSGRKGNVT